MVCRLFGNSSETRQNIRARASFSLERRPGQGRQALSRNGLRGSLGWGSLLDPIAIPNCNLYNLEGLPESPSGFLMTTAGVDQQSRIPSFRYTIGTTEREKKR